MLNKQKGNMYGFVTHTWNPIKGECPHGCSYCYMKKFNEMTNNYELRLDEKAINDNLGTGNFIFVGSSTDMFARDIDKEWIWLVLKRCNAFENKYLFQTKNPNKYFEFKKVFPVGTILATTMESNRHYLISKAPSPRARIVQLNKMKNYYDLMISIEPIMDFDLEVFVSWIKQLRPKFVSIGADSKQNNLEEPPKEKVLELVSELKKFTEVILKPNLSRIIE